MYFADLLCSAGLDLKQVALCLHRPTTDFIRRELAIMVEEAPHLFEAYQSTHHQSAQSTVGNRSWFASFLSDGAGEQTFIGLYRVAGHTPMSAEELDASPNMAMMKSRIRDSPFAVGRWRFDLRPDEHFSDLRRRVVVSDPGARNYMRLAERTPLEVVEIKRRPSVSPPMPAWDVLALATSDIRQLPKEWRTTLSHWRGIYLIVDETDGARYVGSAYGEGNLFRRWEAHVSGEVGVTKELSHRTPSTFRFSILELLSPTATPEEVTQKENRWMDRLHTRRFGLNAGGPPASDASPAPR